MTSTALLQQEYKKRLYLNWSRRYRPLYNLVTSNVNLSVVHIKCIPCSLHFLQTTIDNQKIEEYHDGYLHLFVQMECCYKFLLVTVNQDCLRTFRLLKLFSSNHCEYYIHSGYVTLKLYVFTIFTKVITNYANNFLPAALDVFTRNNTNRILKQIFCFKSAIIFKQ